jgi:hypothetical protein
MVKLSLDSKQHTSYNTYIVNTHTEAFMKGFIAGTVFGLVLATVGFSGIARIFDKGVDTIKTQSVEMAK